MRPYKTIRLIEGPDVDDIKSEGRKSSVGRIGPAWLFQEPRLQARHPPRDEEG